MAVLKRMMNSPVGENAFKVSGTDDQGVITGLYAQNQSGDLDWN